MRLGVGSGTGAGRQGRRGGRVSRAAWRAGCSWVPQGQDAGEIRRRGIQRVGVLAGGGLVSGRESVHGRVGSAERWEAGRSGCGALGCGRRGMRRLGMQGVGRRASGCEVSECGVSGCGVFGSRALDAGRSGCRASGCGAFGMRSVGKRGVGWSAPEGSEATAVGHVGRQSRSGSLGGGQLSGLAAGDGWRKRLCAELGQAGWWVSGVSRRCGMCGPGQRRVTATGWPRDAAATCVASAWGRASTTR